MFARRSSFLSWAGLSLAGALAVAFRLNGGLRRDLWEDEIIATTHAMQPILQLPVEVLRHDVHPFLYFLQLHLWSLLGTSDLWFKLNSLGWNVVAILSIGQVGRLLYGGRVGVLAAVLFALSPTSVWMAQEVRPYSWLFVLIIWGFHAVERACQGGFRAWPVLLRLLALSAAIIYSQAIGFLIVFLFGVYAAVRLVGDGMAVRGARNWIIVFGVAALSAAPPLAVDLTRNANLGAADTLAEVALWVPRMLLPRGDAAVAIGLAASLYVAIVVAGAITRVTRAMVLVFLVLPLALCAALNAAGIVLFKLNVFGTIAAPFVALVTARLLGPLRQGPRQASAGLIAGLLALGSLVFLNDRVPTTGFLAASQMIQEARQPGDLVYVPQPSMFWGMAWYLAGPHWGSALGIAAETSAPWRRVYGRLGPGLVGLLHLEPRTQRITAPDGLVLLVGPTSAPQTVGARRVWLVTYDRADLPQGYPPETLGRLHATRIIPVQQLKVTLYQ